MHAKAHLNEPGAAGVTAVRLLARVDAGVRLEVGRPVELGAAHVAAVRLAVCGISVAALRERRFELVSWWCQVTHVR